MNLKNKNLSKVNDLASRNSDMPKKLIREERDKYLQSDAVDCSNDFEMVAKDLRPPVRRIIVREKLTDAERAESNANSDHEAVTIKAVFAATTGGRPPLAEPVEKSEEENWFSEYVKRPAPYKPPEGSTSFTLVVPYMLSPEAKRFC